MVEEIEKGYFLMTPIIIKIDYSDKDVFVEHEALGIYSDGINEQSAIKGLKLEMIDLFDDLNGEKDENLSQEFIDKKKLINQIIEKK